MDLDRYTAWRIGCAPELLRAPGTHVLPAIPDRHEWLMDPRAAKEPESICLLRRRGASIVRTHATPGPRVRHVLAQLPEDRAVTPDELAAYIDGPFRRDGVDPYLYVDAEGFRPVTADAVRMLDTDDAEALGGLHASVDPRMRWYVEIDHSAVFGRFDGDVLVSVASHFVFDEHRLAATGVLTHAAHRRRGHGTAVVSAAVSWALDRGLVCEWVTNETNVASLALARRLGFEEHEHETEFHLSPAAAT